MARTDRTTSCFLLVTPIVLLTARPPTPARTRSREICDLSDTSTRVLQVEQSDGTVPPRETTAVTIFLPKLRSHKRLKPWCGRATVWLGSARSLLDERVLSQAESRQHYGGTSNCGAKRGPNPTHITQPFCFFIVFPPGAIPTSRSNLQGSLVGVDVPLPPLSESVPITMPSSTRLNALTTSSIVSCYTRIHFLS
ncbi:hypothetical protein BGY98DRAFT_381453 [Russula aff. rugulosa BPL654]|nr:hypothetical protein BGY98DRAFT_381453 [Russula aff. rugulosa BPL654]